MKYLIATLCTLVTIAVHAEDSAMAVTAKKYLVAVSNEDWNSVISLLSSDEVAAVHNEFLPLLENAVETEQGKSAIGFLFGNPMNKQALNELPAAEFASRIIRLVVMPPRYPIQLDLSQASLVAEATGAKANYCIFQVPTTLNGQAEGLSDYPIQMRLNGQNVTVVLGDKIRMAAAGFKAAVMKAK